MLSLIDFQRLALQYDKIPVERVLLSDGLTPVLALKRMSTPGSDEHAVTENSPAGNVASPKPLGTQTDTASYSCLFESVVGGEKVGRYSFLGVQPRCVITATASQVTVHQKGQIETLHFDNPIEYLRQEVTRFSIADRPELPPLLGGAIGYVGYDVVRYFEDLPNPPLDDRHLPDLAFGLYDELIVFDHVYKTLSIIVLAQPSEFMSTEACFADAQDRIAGIEKKLSNPKINLAPRRRDFSSDTILHFDSNFTQAEFEAAVDRCVEYILAGDIFQVVLSQRFQAKVTCDPLEVYRSLRVLNPSPFMFYLQMPDQTLVGSSPEIMCRVMDGEVTVRPLAGTRPRGKTDAEDKSLEEELRADPKECAEHVMLVDLGRNDVGRVAKVGSIQLPDVMIVERYSHVMHLSSTVTGQLRDDCDAFDALGATLPAGTVSGAPKIRAMEIIDSLEPHKRGPYAGAVGYLDYSGNMDTCITLRTLVMQGGYAYIQAGAGIVADSQASAEYQETLNKARGLMRAVEVTVNDHSLKTSDPSQAASD